MDFSPPSEREITPFFASLHGYVAIAEELPLARLPKLMNAYFETCTAAIEEGGGTLDQFVGDAIIAMFGAPATQPDHALRACVAALRCQRGMMELRARLASDVEPWPERVRRMRLRVGLHTGVATLGHMGTATRFNYTMMGDHVNRAARLESAAKSFGVWTLCSGTTYEACERASPGRVVFRSIGSLIVVGRPRPLELFELMALREDATPRMRECIAVFAAGHACYQQRDWAGAIRLFEKSAALESDQPTNVTEDVTNASQHFLRLARRCASDPGAVSPAAEGE